MNVITRANTERHIVKRLGPLMTKAAMAVTVDGTNDDLQDDIAAVLMLMGHAPDDITAIDDDDIARIVTASVPEFFDRLHEQVLETLVGRFKNHSLTVEGITLYSSDLARQCLALLAQKRKQNTDRWGEIGGGIGTVLLSLGFAQQGPESTGD